MTTCPRCGRIAEDEIVCGNCGLSLALIRRAAAEAGSGALIDEFAAEDDSGDGGRDVRVWRFVGLVALVCVLAAAAAIVLLHQHGSGKRNAGLPVLAAPGTTASTSGLTPASTTRRPSTSSLPSTRVTPSPSRSTSPRPSRTATRSTSSTPTSAPPSTPPSRTRAIPARSVQVAQGAVATQCGPHCYLVSVTLSGFPSGSYRVTCQATRGGLFGQYTTSSSVSAQCSYRRPNDSVWVVVDGRYRSNTLAWPR